MNIARTATPDETPGRPVAGLTFDFVAASQGVSRFLEQGVRRVRRFRVPDPSDNLRRRPA